MYDRIIYMLLGHVIYPDGLHAVHGRSLPTSGLLLGTFVHMEICFAHCMICIPHFTYGLLSTCHKQISEKWQRHWMLYILYTRVNTEYVVTSKFYAKQILTQKFGVFVFFCEVTHCYT